MRSKAASFVARNQCPCCRSPDMVDKFKLDGIRIAICSNCGFMFTRDVRSNTDLSQHYITGYDDKRQIDGQRVNASVNSKMIRRLAVELSGKSLLDVGSGYGYFLSYARKAGAKRVVGIELSDAERRYSIDELNVEAVSTVGSLGIAEQFDVVTMFEVIEHIPEPHEFIQIVTSYLKAGGSLIIGTDNFTSRVVQTLGNRFPKWIPHEHISLFTPESLCSLINGAGGLKVVGQSSFTPWELGARELLFKATKGAIGGKKFSLRAEEARGGGRPYRYFALRLAVNGVWFAATNQADLGGAMMFVHAIKA